MRPHRLCSLLPFTFCTLMTLSSAFAEASSAHLGDGGAAAASGGGGGLAAAAQNPIASMISLPIDTTIDFGATNGTAVVANIQPVIPASLGDWNLVSRFILPVAYLEGPVGGLPSIPQAPVVAGKKNSIFGIGDLNYTGFFSPAKAGEIIWGVGPSISFPTATDPQLGSEKWSAGPSVVVLAQPKPWSLGILGRQLWSFAGKGDRAHVNQTLIQPFINYNLDNGWFINIDPVILANWNVRSSDRWTVPVGGGVGRIFKIGDQPVNVRVRAYYNVVRPDNGPDWTINLAFAWLFPK